MKIKAVIFDMDGIIIDSEPLQMKAFQETLKKYGVRISRKEFISLIGFDTRSNFILIKKKYSIKDPVDKLIRIKNRNYRRILKKNLKERKGTGKLIRQLSEDNYLLALASSSEKKDIDIIVNGLNLKRHLSIVVSGDQVNNKKPHPQIFLITASKLKLKPCDCLVIEDSKAGVIAAKKAGMKCIAVPTEFTIDHDFSSADIVLYKRSGKINMFSVYRKIKKIV